ncbi:putative periplasmic serine endoprotease DegP-like protein [Brucella endophytica]|uniref:Probable periplasmic serine endoprotease DegP-like n=1 Tax=Brucella endophytica TaxID=1963359 RepID=A0A916WEP3_9HYPH|nr:DegQ family serine endoprotease [Brucella endophytica]GGA93518.1 putative periplasmic serine endoprotease DegP-like protein [Brucella endophytica]
MSKEKSPSVYRKRMYAVALTSALAGAVLANGPLSTVMRAYADPVTVTAPAQPGFADLVEKVRPAVVSVRVDSDKKPDTSDSIPGFFSAPGFDQLPDNHPLKRFFREFGPDGQTKRPGKQRPRRERPVAQGSGFFISDDGYIVTNNHVVADGNAYSVVLQDGTELPAKLVGTDPRTDLAVLKVNDPKRKFTYVALGDDKNVRVGDWVVAVGNPFGLGGTVTAGIVSALGRDINAGPYDDFIQIDASVNRGNSGGPTFNQQGQVIGINTAIFSPSGGSVGIAFAIPAATAKTVVDQIIKTGHVQRGWIGVTIQPVNKEIAESLGLAEPKGALIAEPQDGGPAAKAGLEAGDVVTAVNGEPVENSNDLARKVAAIAPGSKAELTIWRKNAAKTINVTVGTMPKELAQAPAGKPTMPQDSESLDSYGLTVVPSEDGKGVVVTDVDPDSDAADKGISSGDVIISANNKPVKDVSDINAAISEAKKAGRKAILLQIMTNDQSRFVALPIAKG